MKNKKKISASEQRTLWGSRVVIWITMIVVLFPVIWIVMSSFSAGDSFSCPHCSLKNSALNIMWNCFGKRILESGFLIPKVLLYCSNHTTCAYFTCSVCVCKTAVCGKKIWTDGTFDITGVSKQHGSCRILYFNL